MVLVNASSGSALKGANVVVNINDVNYNVKITSSGQGRLSLADLDYGTYTVTASYKGNAKYNAANITEDIVVKDEVNISVVYDGDADELVVGLVDAVSGSALKGANVVVIINNVNYNVKITSTGQGKLSISDLTPGPYLVVASYKGNAKYGPSYTTANIVKS